MQGAQTKLVIINIKLQQQNDVNNNNQESDFSFAQRIESLKTLVVGAFAGEIALTPFAALHDGNLIQTWAQLRLVCLPLMSHTLYRNYEVVQLAWK